MMRRASKKNAAAAAAAAVTAGNKGAAKEQEKIEAFFQQYAEKHEDGVCIGPEGVERLCLDLGLEPTDIRVLLLAWKLSASQMGYFSHEEWAVGMRHLRCDSIEKLRKTLPALQQEIAAPLAFQDFFRFAFRYCLTEPRQKTLDVDTAVTMLDLVAPSRPHESQFVQFLQEQTEYKAINEDQWTAFLRFSSEVRPDLSNYDPNAAWPLLMDNFVEWLEARKACAAEQAL